MIPRPWAVLPALAVLVICLAAAWPTAIAQGGGSFVYPLDDAYIHMAMAKNLARHGIWGVTPHEFSSSSSSPLWTLALGAAYAATGVRDLTPFVLNGLFAMLLLVAAERFLALFGVAAWTRALAVAGLVVAAQLPSLVLMGMEHVLHLLLTVWFAGLAVLTVGTPERGAAFRRPSGLVLCAAGALLAASRYEGFFLVGVVCLLLLAKGRAGLGLGLGAAAAAPSLAFGAISVINGSLFLPNSLLLKAGGEQLSSLAVLFKPPGADDVELFRRHPALLVVVAVGAGAALLQGIRLRSPWRPQVLMPLLLVAITALHAHFAFSSMFWVYRYDAYLVGLGVVAAAAAAGGLRRPLAQAAAVVVLALMIAAATDRPEAVELAASLAAVRENYLEHYRAAEFVGRYYPAGPVVVNDIGAVCYLTDARVLDMFGLGSIEPLKIRRANAGAYTADDVARWTSVHHPSAAILQLGWGWVVPRVPPGWTKVAELVVSTHDQTLGFFAMTPDGAMALRQRVRDYYEPLVQDGQYTLRLF